MCNAHEPVTIYLVPIKSGGEHLTRPTAGCAFIAAARRR